MDFSWNWEKYLQRKEELRPNNSKAWKKDNSDRYSILAIWYQSQKSTFVFCSLTPWNVYEKNIDYFDQTLTENRPTHQEEYLPQIRPDFLYLPQVPMSSSWHYILPSPGNLLW